MIRKSNIFWVLVMILTSCGVTQNRIIGQYNSTCALYGNQSIVVVKVNKDSTFSYSRPYVEEDVIGNWEIVKNTLVLTSEEFSAPHDDEFSPRFKYTAADGKDIYLITGKRLLMADKEGFKRECYLLKVE